jgi:hypothetical protein
VPSKPGYEPLSQAKPSRHPEVAGYQPDPAAPSRVPRPVTADRNYGEPATDRDLEALGVRTVAIPRKAKVSPARRDAEHAGGSAGSSSGAPAPKAGSATSSADSAGIAPGWTAAEEPRSGARTVTSPTTWSRSAPWPADRPGTQCMPCRTSRPNSVLRLSQVEVVRTIPIPISAWEHTARPRK